MVDVNPTDWWTVHCGQMPILGTAIHNGHLVRPAILDCMAISDAERLREEDPFTEFLIQDLPNRIVFHRSRFEIDLNRRREAAVYISPKQAWGMNIWKVKPTTHQVDISLKLHDAYYAMLKQVLDNHEKLSGKFVVLDVHSYNHRRNGPNALPSPPDEAPDINIGTFSMDRRRWAHIVDPLIDKLRAFEFCGRGLDVRENVAFQGKGEQARFVHEEYPETGCAIAIDFKKFFMDEWSGIPDKTALIALRSLVASTLPLLEQSLRAGK